MSDYGDMCREMRQHRREAKERLASNSGWAMELLQKSEFDYSIISHGHLRVEGEVDYWPSTGTWFVLETKERGHGIKQLLKKLRSKNGGE
jgi:hypothetical protein